MILSANLINENFYSCDFYMRYSPWMWSSYFLYVKELCLFYYLLMCLLLMFKFCCKSFWHWFVEVLYVAKNDRFTSSSWSFENNHPILSTVCFLWLVFRRMFNNPSIVGLLNLFLTFVAIPQCFQLNKVWALRLRWKFKK